MRRRTRFLICVVIILVMYVASYALISWRGQFGERVSAHPFFSYVQNEKLDRTLHLLYLPVYAVDHKLLTRRTHFEPSREFRLLIEKMD